MKVGFTGLLALIFIALKLTNSLTWSWVWVLSPIWISTLLWASVLVLMAVSVAISQNKHRY